MMQGQPYNQGAYKEDFYGYSNSRWELDAIEFLNNVQLFLQGYYINHEGRVIKGSSDGYMNEKGASRVISILMTAVNQHTIMSNIDNRQIKNTGISIAVAILDDLIKNYPEYDIDLEHIENIVEVMQTMVENILSRAEGGKERDQRLTPRQTFVAPNYEEQEKKRGFFGI